MNLRNPKIYGALALLIASGALAMYGQPSVEQKWTYLSPKYEPRLLDRQVQIDPAELLDLMEDDYINLVILDVRSESDWNQFHLLDSERISLEEMTQQHKRFRDLPENTVVVLVSNDEILSTEAWKRLMVLGAPNAYILEGGLNHWLNIYGHAEDEEHGDEKANLVDADGTLRHPFRLALGSRHPAARPDVHHAPKREYTPKVKLLKKMTKSGGCG